MGKIKLFCVLLNLFLPLTTTEVSTVSPPGYQQTTMQPNQGTPKATPDTPDQIYTATIVPPKAKALETETIMATTLATSTKQNQTIANLEATTIHATKEVQTMIENVEISTPAINSTVSGTISSMSSGYTSSMQTSTNKTETPTVVVPTETATTRVVPTAKLSATTQTVPSVQNTTNLDKTTKLANTTEFVSTVKIPTTTKRVPNIQTTTMKPAQTTGKIYPSVVTEQHATSKSEDAKKAVKHGKIVAGLIGGVLIMMMIGFLVILYKKHKLKKHQIATTDWAGPTPFLETGGGGGDNGHVTLRSTNRISLTSFLPQRLSKRLSLLAESAEEMQDMQEMTTGTTFAANDEKYDTKLKQNLEKSDTEANENNSESSGKTEEVVLVDEMKENEGGTSKDKQNGQALMKDGETGQLENGAAQPAPKEDAPIESTNENKEAIEKNKEDNVV